MSNKVIHGSLKMSAIALLALTVGLTACGGGGGSSDDNSGTGSSTSGTSGGLGGGTSGGTTGGGITSSLLPTFSGITSASPGCTAQAGVANPLQSQLDSLTSLLPGGASGPAAGLTSVLSSLLNTNDLLTGGLQTLSLSGSPTSFLSSVTGSASSLTCSTELLSNTLSQLASTANLPTGAGSPLGLTGIDITSLLGTLTNLQQASAAGQSLDLTALSTQLGSLSSALTALAPVLSGISGGSPTAILTSTLGSNFGDLSQIFGQLGVLNSSGLEAALPLQLSDLTGLLGTTNGASQLGLPLATLLPDFNTLSGVLGNENSILGSLSGLLGGGGLLGSLLGGLLL